MKTIPLTQGQVALVDDGDYAWLARFKWHFDGNYAAKALPRMGNRVCKVRLHSLLLPPKEGAYTDHINRDKLDNRRCNLRYVNPTESVLNQARSDNTSGFRGARVRRKGERVWVATARLYGKPYHIGCFDSPEEAASAYTAFVNRGLKGDTARKLMGKPNRNNTSGARNVYLMWNGRWQVTVRRNGKIFRLGCYPTRDAALKVLKGFHEEVR